MLLIQDPALMMPREPAASMSVGERERTAGLFHRVIQDRAVLVIESDMGCVGGIAQK
jgi:urea transport system ATP-binding protein